MSMIHFGTLLDVVVFHLVDDFDTDVSVSYTEKVSSFGRISEHRDIETTYGRSLAFLSGM